MSGSEMGSREQFPLGFHKPQPQPPQPPQQQVQSMRLDFASDGGAVYKTTPTFHQSPTVAAHVNGGETAAAAVPQGNVGLGQVSGSSTEPLKRKRGRPRKYGPEAAMSLALPNASPPPPPPHHHQLQFPSAPVSQPSVPVSQPSGPVSQPSAPVSQPTGPVSQPAQPAGPFSPPPPPPPSASVSSGSSKKRGRPRGSRNRNISTKKSSVTAGSLGSSFTPHVIYVKAGEDLSSRIMTLSQNGPRNVCILSANGSISNVTLRQPATSGGAVNYEGRFEILALTGSLLPNANGNQQDRLGGLSVSLSGPDGRVLGGGVAGPLIAAAPVQLVLGSFLGRKEAKSSHKIEDASAATATGGQSSSPSGGTLSESSGGSGSPFNQSGGASNHNHPPGISGMPWK